MFRRITVLILVLLLLTSGCSRTPPPETTAPTDEPIPETTAPTDEPILETTAPPPTTEVPTQPTDAPSPLRIPGVEAEDVICYFNEVCLDAEFTHSGDPSRLQKWATPIRYRVYGSPTPEDMAVLDGFVQWLNTLEGFPGMAEAEEDWDANFRIHFCTQEEMISRMGETFYGLDGAVTFWYDFNQIYDAIVCIRTDLDQTLRNSVILEELYNSLGPIQDTSLREDSIIYAGFSEPQQLTAMDELLLKLLYHPALECGMDAAACEACIRELYN